MNGDDNIMGGEDSSSDEDDNGQFFQRKPAAVHEPYENPNTEDDTTNWAF